VESFDSRSTDLYAEAHGLPLASLLDNVPAAGMICMGKHPLPVGTYTRPPKPGVISEPIVRDANRPQGDGLATLQASAPAVLHEDADRIEVAPRAGRHARTAIEFDRGMTIRSIYHTL